MIKLNKFERELCKKYGSYSTLSLKENIDFLLLEIKYVKNMKNYKITKRVLIEKREKGTKSNFQFK